MKEKEERAEHAVATFGRFNPPTAGHKKLIDKVRHLAKHHGADHHVFASPTKDAKKNPLSHKEKVVYLNQMAPGTNICPDSSVKNPLDMMKHLQKLGYKKVTVVVGEDRLQAMNNLLHKYNGKEFKIENLKIVSAGHRDPDAEGVEGISASKMRDAAKASNFKEFCKGVSDKNMAKSLYSSVRKGLKMNESNALFLVGGPGSGKDFLIEHVGQGFLEFPLSKLAQCINEKVDIPALYGNPDLVVNGNADQKDNIILSKLVLEAMGYTTAMVYVYTTNEESKIRNDVRINSGSKTITEEVRLKKYQDSVSALSEYKEMFQENFIIFDNSKNLGTINEEAKQEVEAWIQELKEMVKEFFEPKSEIDQLFEEKVEGKSKSTKKAAKPPSVEMDVRVDGGAATNTFGYAGEEFQPKTLKAIRLGQDWVSKVTSEESDIDLYGSEEVYEDWGLKKEQGIFEGRTVSLNTPWRRSGKDEYSVYVMESNQVIKLDFVKKGKKIVESQTAESTTITNKEFWSNYDVRI